MFSIFTCTINREFYLKRQLESILLLSDYNKFNYEHIILFQKHPPSNDFINFIETLPFKNNVKIKYFSDIKPDGEVMNIFKKEITFPIFIKLDDDAILRSPNYFSHVLEISNLIPNSVFSPFPVGLINNLGGVPSSDRSVVYGKSMDTFYTLRKVQHVGGFARIIPKKLIQEIHFSNGRHEDTDVSNWCKLHNINMYYLENSLIVEHAESTLGQHVRFGEAYFQGRF